MSEDITLAHKKPAMTSKSIDSSHDKSRLLAQWFKWFAPSLCVLGVFLIATQVGTYPQYVATLLVVSMLIGTALTVLVGFARCITLASGAMLALGAYGSTILVAKFGFPFIPALLMGAVIGGIGGFILGLPAVRFRGHNLAMVTLVFQSVVIIGLREWKSMTEGAAGLQVPLVTIAGIQLKSDISYLAFAAIVAAIVLLIPIGLLIGRFGRNLKAIAGNEVAAQAFGISIAQHLIAAFVISSAVLAIAGGLQAPRSRIIDPESYGILASIATLAYPIVGGMSSIWGGLLGGTTLRLLPELLRPVADYQELLFAGLVLLTVLFFPGGIAGQLAKLRRAKPAEASGQAQPGKAPALQAPAPTRVDNSALLHVGNVSKSFDALRAVDKLTLSVHPGEILGLMGPNGAGKTTLFNMLSGFTKPDTGSISAFGLSLEKEGATSRMSHGITRTFQHVAIFRDLSCYDNVAIGLGGNGIMRVLGGSFTDLAARAAGESAKQKIMAALEGVGLAAQSSVMAGQLSLGDQRRLEIARAIVSGPKLLLLDEPVSGVSEEEIHRIGDLLKKINRETGMAMLLIEHNIGFLAQMSSRIFVMAAGAAITEGTPEQVMANESVQQLYFGKTADA
ncbi:MAG: branched-chain amino acid ABC transporter ATP-binding protein/permease [Polaromonas sp.]|uniref:branched-chain amino acid ABC transporter ATP-binding protein/permease n=1 Tax=Polaromonas sp. TaxID=1869339 RepID=UPI0025FDA6DE|nr:branched-chain amino acid ABC transporter ATP-binding protein/permease [Polaromonas sp.]MBI2725381.1 branched-chain amino acid ABC transporter ATP-binding protein/permease [Polaromonas sp.]